jgi:hypothetical protein
VAVVTKADGTTELSLQSMLDEVSRAHDAALKIEDYDEAKNLLAAKKQLQQLVIDSTRIRREKELAARNDDFETAIAMQDQGKQLQSTGESAMLQVIETSNLIPEAWKSQFRAMLPPPIVPPSRFPERVDKVMTHDPSNLQELLELNVDGEESQLARRRRERDSLEMSSNEASPTAAGTGANEPTPALSDSVRHALNLGVMGLDAVPPLQAMSSPNISAMKLAVMNDDSRGGAIFRSHSPSSHLVVPACYSDIEEGSQGEAEEGGTEDAFDSRILPDPLGAAELVAYDDMVTVFGAGPVSYFADSHWQYRMEGISNMEAALGEIVPLKGARSTLRAAAGATRRAMLDRVVGVKVQSIYLLSQTIVATAKALKPASLHACLDEALPSLIDAVCNSNMRVRRASHALILWLTTSEIVSVSYVFSHILNTSSAPMSGQMTSRMSTNVKRVLGRLELLTDLITIHGLPPHHRMSHHAIMSYTLPFLKGTQMSLREGAVHVATEVYRRKGDSIERYLQEIPPRIAASICSMATQEPTRACVVEAPYDKYIFADPTKAIPTLDPSPKKQLHSPRREISASLLPVSSTGDLRSTSPTVMITSPREEDPTADKQQPESEEQAKQREAEKEEAARLAREEEEREKEKEKERLEAEAAAAREAEAAAQAKAEAEAKAAATAEAERLEKERIEKEAAEKARIEKEQADKLAKMTPKELAAHKKAEEKKAKEAAKLKAAEDKKRAAEEAKRKKEEEKAAKKKKK